MKGMTEWLANWKRRGWITADKKPVKNAELWQALDEQVGRHQVSWRWVKGMRATPATSARISWPTRVWKWRDGPERQGAPGRHREIP